MGCESIRILPLPAWEFCVQGALAVLLTALLWRGLATVSVVVFAVMYPMLRVLSSIARGDSRPWKEILLLCLSLGSTYALVNGFRFG
jgi:succinate dehydrogenase/fumarate reductase cytochrome b subunit